MGVYLKAKTEPKNPEDLSDFNIHVKRKSDYKRVEHWLFYQSNLLDSVCILNLVFYIWHLKIVIFKSPSPYLCLILPVFIHISNVNECSNLEAGKFE